MSNGHYPSPNIAYQGVHALIGYGAVVTAAFKLHHWTWGFVAVLVFALAKEFIIDIFGKEHDSFMSSVQDFTFYMVGAAVGIIVVTVVT
jgi:hypothetical protein